MPQTREKWSNPSLPQYKQPDRKGLQGGGGVYRDPACSLKLNTDNNEDTSRCISTDTHDMHSKRAFKERSESWFTRTLLSQKVKDDKINTT